MSIQTILPPIHSDHDSAFVIPDYPYGGLRCEKRVWLEVKAKKGTRLVEQTQNPKTMRWNNPKASTYDQLSGALYLDEKGHVQYEGLSGYSDFQKVKTFLDTFGKNCTQHADLVRFNRLQELFGEEKSARDNPSYGTPEYKAAYIAACKRQLEEEKAKG